MCLALNLPQAKFGEASAEIPKTEAEAFSTG